MCYSNEETFTFALETSVKEIHILEKKHQREETYCFDIYYTVYFIDKYGRNAGRIETKNQNKV